MNINNGLCSFGSLSVDASTQAGWHYLVARTDDVLWNRTDGNNAVIDISERKVLPSWRRENVVLGCIGSGEEDTAHKLRVLLHRAKITCGSPERVEE